MTLILAPLRGVTVRCFRRTYAPEIREAGFAEAVSPFVSAAPGLDPLKDRELCPGGGADEPVPLVPQFIGKDPVSFSACIRRAKEGGFIFFDLNCGCPFPMVRNKGRGSGLLRNPANLERMLAAGCEAAGDGKLSVKARLGVDSPGELLSLMPVLNSFPLRRLVVHARTARQMYSGACDMDAFRRVCEAAAMPVAYNGDSRPGEILASGGTMCGRGFVRMLGSRPDSRERLADYVSASLCELGHPSHVLGRIKELVAYWKDIECWKRKWSLIKISRSLEELLSVI